MVSFPRIKICLVALVSGLGVAGSSSAAVLLATDFSGRTVAGKTANNVIWTQNGLSAPSSLTAVDEVPTSGAFTALFDTPNAQGHFAPDKNIGNEGPWSVTVPLTLTSPSVSLESIDIDWQHFTNSGGFQGPARPVRWTVTVTGSSSGLLDTVIGTANATSGIENLAFTSALSLTDAETYDVRFFVENDNNTIGNNTGFDGLTFNGEVIPEPGAVAFLGIAAAGLLMRRRRRA